MPRAYWKGSLKLSLVTCPIALYPAITASEKTRFHMINTETGNRLVQQMVDSETGDVVDKDQKGRGYEIKKGRYVPIEKEDLDAIEVESNHTIDIDSFVPRDEIDQRYLDRPYYVVPDGKAGVDAFAVIRDAMKDKDRVALARPASRGPATAARSPRRIRRHGRGRNAQPRNRIGGLRTRVGRPSAARVVAAGLHGAARIGR